MRGWPGGLAPRRKLPGEASRPSSVSSSLRNSPVRTAMSPMRAADSRRASRAPAAAERLSLPESIGGSLAHNLASASHGGGSSDALASAATAASASLGTCGDFGDFGDFGATPSQAAGLGDYGTFGDPPGPAASAAGTTAPAALREAPTFCPTEAEFQNPLRYILSIREEAERYGICCIKPPPSWRPPFMIDLNRLRFPTRVQKINELLIRKTQRLKFMKALAEFCDAAGTPLSKLPTMGGREIDLHLLYTQVGKRGGFERATAERKWTEIAERMNMHHASGSHLAAALKKQYQQLLLPYERYAAGLDPPPAGIAAAPGSKPNGSWQACGCCL